ncbi:MAG TPA: VOC family protein [Thermoanaerobaculia bacterium]|nr:VOC family protein [Thermoanaerobaculia bacterium]
MQKGIAESDVLTEERQESRNRPLLRNTRAFSSFSVDDLKRAKAFYGTTLGMKAAEKPMGLELTTGDGFRIFVYEKKDHSPATFTILNFPVADVERAVADLRQRGVRFEIYDKGDLKTDGNGIARGNGGPTIAWFKDPAGNFLSLVEES